MATPKRKTAKKKSRRGPVRATSTVYLRLPKEMVQQIREASRTRGWTMNRWVETLFEEILPKK